MILIVDDKPENVFSLKIILEAKGFLVDTAYSGQEALKKVLKNDYALIILDVQMPIMNGFEVAESLGSYSKTNDIAIIFLSAINIDKKYVTKGYHSGAVDYLTKPVDPDILILKINVFYRIYEQKVLLKEAENKLKKENIFRKQVQVELKNRVQYLNTIFQSLPQIAFKADFNGNVTFVNDHWYEYSSSSHRFPVQAPGFSAIKTKFKECVGKKTEFEYEVSIRNLKTGLFRFHLLRVIPVIEGRKIIKWVGTFTDIEEQKQVEKRKDEFLSIASHELKTPLTSVKGYVQLLGRLSDTIDNEKIVSLHQKALNQVIKLEGLVSDLLDVSRINNSKLQIYKEYFDLDSLITNAINTIEQNHKSSGIKIERVGDTFFDQIYGDANRIEQVLINFLTNAVKYSPGTFKIIVRTIFDKDKVVVEVQDFGIGIPEDKKDFIFNKFYRVDESSVSFQGLGIGLYICSEIIKQHNGTYGIVSRLGKGTQMFFTLPYSKKTND